MRKLLLLPFLLTLLAGCAATTQDAEIGGERAAFKAADYALGPGDELRVTVFGEEELSGELGVDSSGQISMPLVGEVPAEGLSVAALREAVTARLADGYLRDPRVSIEVVNYRPFYILGEVGSPGEYNYQSGLTVLNAVATAGGFTYRANKRHVFIQSEGEAQEIRYDLTSTTPVRPGDQIRIGERLF